jgi:flagellar P-ring protein precursor FlgI
MARLLLFLLAIVLAPALASANEVRVRDLGRFLGQRDNALIGYGIVTGLAGSGDSPRSEVTRQALRNALSRLGASISPELLQSRNVAVVIVTANLPATANVGDRLDVNVSSIGDARSLAGGTLLMTPLLGPDQRPYALAQGSLVVGGHRFDSQLNSNQRNYPTAGTVAGGASVETPLRASLVSSSGELVFVLRDPDFGTAERIADGINRQLGAGAARMRGADSIIVAAGAAADVNSLIARIESVTVEPVPPGRIVINERSGTVVAGESVQISSVVISQGDIRVSVTARNEASQPGYFNGAGNDVQSLIVTNTQLDVEQARDAVVRLPNTSVGDLVQALQRARVDTRGMIAILQAMRAAGALHAEIVVQ